MSDAFDPYHKWLGIPPGEQPPHHYRLLGIMPFESDADVISNAADQRMVHVRSFQSGKHSALSQRILNEISTARVCLLDRQKKPQYDAQLRQRLQPQPGTVPVFAPAKTGLSPSDAPSLPPPLPGEAASPPTLTGLSPSDSPKGTVPFSLGRKLGLSPESLTGKITVADAARAEVEIQSCEQALAKLEQGRKQSRGRLRWNALKLGWADLIVRVRPLAEKAPLGRLGVAIIAVGLSFALGLIAASIVTLRGAALAAGGLLAMLSGATVAVLALFFPPDGFLTNWIQWLRDESAKLRAAIEQADRDIARARQTLDRVKQEHGRLVEVLQSRRHRLMTTDWRSLRGHPFEDFLREVLEELGYSVQRTETTVDQGVDLIVERDGVKVAVQAKSYADALGDDAVQQVYAGMAFYKCQRCVVIANSGFTPSARELAVQRGCMLIDGSQMPALLEGRISV
jgi:hypothetical protein